MIVIADTSGLLAALDRTHPDTQAAGRTLLDAGTVVVSPVLLAELDHVGRRVLGPEAASAAIDDIQRWAKAGRAVLPEITPRTLAVAQEVRGSYPALQLDLTDAVNVALAAQFRTNAVLTLDYRDFRAIRPLTQHPAFQVLPADT